ncbi:MAG: DUF2141 domain-containing protein [Psychroserpens sp.]|uniref:DUF2141 domain-containing protein n=1 Tax=Psychroserpens sp. TaxID=2020870 RepID=UPI003C8A058A
MNTVVKMVILFIFSQVLNAQESVSYDIIVNVKNIDNNKGKVFVGLFNSKDTFLTKRFNGENSSIQNQSCVVTFKNIPAGTYAISLFHDENENNKMDTNFLGIPSEDYGCSNNATGFMGPPKWKDAKFELSTKTITQTITL